MISISQYSGKCRNATMVSIGNIDIYFSYQTIIAFRNSVGIVACENVWSNITGKHLNAIESDKKKRLPRVAFLSHLEALERYLDGVN